MKVTTTVRSSVELHVSGDHFDEAGHLCVRISGGDRRCENVFLLTLPLDDAERLANELLAEVRLISPPDIEHPPDPGYVEGA